MVLALTDIWIHTGNDISHSCPNINGSHCGRCGRVLQLTYIAPPPSCPPRGDEGRELVIRTVNQDRSANQ